MSSLWLGFSLNRTLCRSLRLFSSSNSLHKKQASSQRWLNRQSKDMWVQRARAQNMRSRAAFKLEQINSQFRLFKPGMTVVDLGFAPGSWSQVAYARTRPHGRVIGVDLLPVEPPTGVSCLQGDFLDPNTKQRLREVLKTPGYGRHKPAADICITDAEVMQSIAGQESQRQKFVEHVKQREPSEDDTQTVDIVLSDMCGIFPQDSGFFIASINNVYDRLANTSGLIARDHAQSIALCDAALQFAIEVLRPGGSFVCKFYTGEEDQELESRLRRVFKQVKRVKPDACRQESREMYFVALKKRARERAPERTTDGSYL